MIYKKIKFFIPLLIVSFGSKITQAQVAVLSSGGEASSSSGSVSFSIGQVFYSMDSSSSFSISEGVQQAYEISIVTGIENKDFPIELRIYPNPTSNVLTLRIDTKYYMDHKYQLYDMNGKFIEANGINNYETFIDMENLVPAIYLLRVLHNNSVIKTFKIVKY